MFFFNKLTAITLLFFSMTISSAFSADGVDTCRNKGIFDSLKKDFDSRYKVDKLKNAADRVMQLVLANPSAKENLPKIVQLNNKVWQVQKVLDQFSGSFHLGDLSLDKLEKYIKARKEKEELIKNGTYKKLAKFRHQLKKSLGTEEFKNLLKTEVAKEGIKISDYYNGDLIQLVSGAAIPETKTVAYQSWGCDAPNVVETTFSFEYAFAYKKYPLLYGTVKKNGESAECSDNFGNMVLYSIGLGKHISKSDCDSDFLVAEYSNMKADFPDWQREETVRSDEDNKSSNGSGGHSPANLAL